MDIPIAAEKRAPLEEALIRLDPEWIVLRDLEIGTPPQVIAADYVLLHGKLGIALVDVAPGRRQDPVEAFRRFLDDERFTAFFPGFLPIAWLIVEPDETAVGDRLNAAFAVLPPTAITDPEWADAVNSLLVAPEPPEPQPLPQPPPVDTPMRIERMDAAAASPRPDWLNHPRDRLDRPVAPHSYNHGPIAEAPYKMPEFPMPEYPMSDYPMLERATRRRRWPTVVAVLVTLVVGGTAWLLMSAPDTDNEVEPRSAEIPLPPPSYLTPSAPDVASGTAPSSSSASAEAKSDRAGPIAPEPPDALTPPPAPPPVQTPPEPATAVQSTPAAPPKPDIAQTAPSAPEPPSGSETVGPPQQSPQGALAGATESAPADHPVDASPAPAAVTPPAAPPDIAEPDVAQTAPRVAEPSPGKDSAGPPQQSPPGALAGAMESAPPDRPVDAAPVPSVVAPPAPPAEPAATKPAAVANTPPPQTTATSSPPQTQSRPRGKPTKTTAREPAPPRPAPAAHPVPAARTGPPIDAADLPPLDTADLPPPIAALPPAPSAVSGSPSNTKRPVSLLSRQAPVASSGNTTDNPTSTLSAPDSLPPAGVTAEAAGTGTDTDKRVCRIYTTTKTVQGKAQAVTGLACRLPDGQWQLVTESPAP